MKNFVIVASVSRGNGFCKMYLDQTEQWFLMITQTLPDVRMQYHGITAILRADKEPHHTSTAIGHWTASCCILELRNGVTLCAPFYWRGPRLNLIALMSVIPSWNRLDERIQMSVVLKFFTELPWRKKFSNGVIFTHPRIFRRFLADISETVPLR